VSTFQKSVAHKATRVKTRGFKTVCVGKWIHSSESTLCLEFLAQKCNKHNSFYDTI
jgi:hypothetical protein